MDKAIVADNKPVEAQLEGGKTYYWCSCGKSENQPFCDGSHEGTSFTPKAFTPEKPEAAYLCQCKQTKTPPYCDGSHAEL